MKACLPGGIDVRCRVDRRHRPGKDGYDGRSENLLGRLSTEPTTGLEHGLTLPTHGCAPLETNRRHPGPACRSDERGSERPAWPPGHQRTRLERCRGPRAKARDKSGRRSRRVDQYPRLIRSTATASRRSGPDRPSPKSQKCLLGAGRRLERSRSSLPRRHCCGIGLLSMVPIWTVKTVVSRPVSCTDLHRGGGTQTITPALATLE